MKLTAEELRQITEARDECTRVMTALEREVARLNETAASVRAERVRGVLP